LIITILLAQTGFLIGVSRNTLETVDEASFVSIAKTPGDWSTSADRVMEVCPPREGWSEEFIRSIYISEYWFHPPLPAYLVLPLVSLTDNIYILRIFTILLFVASIFLVYLAVKKEKGNRVALLSLIGVIGCLTLTRGASNFYYDSFMAFFFALSWYLIVVGSKWKYVSTAALVVCRIQAPIFLIPLILKDRNWKLVLPGIAFVVYYMGGWAVTSDIFWLLDFWRQQALWAVPVRMTIPYTILLVYLIPVALLSLPSLKFVRYSYPEVVAVLIPVLTYLLWGPSPHTLTILGPIIVLVTAIWVGPLVRRFDEKTKLVT